MAARARRNRNGTHEPRDARPLRAGTLGSGAYARRSWTHARRSSSASPSCSSSAPRSVSVDRRARIHPRTARAAGIAAACFGIVVVLAGVAVVTERYGAPWTMADSWLEEFRTEQSPASAPGTTYLTSGLGGGRHDLWRVAWTLFRENPVTGVGVDNFTVQNVKLRRRAQRLRLSRTASSSGCCRRPGSSGRRCSSSSWRRRASASRERCERAHRSRAASPARRRPRFSTG